MVTHQAIGMHSDVQGLEVLQVIIFVYENGTTVVAKL